MKLLVATEMIGGRFHRIRSSAAAKCAVRPKLRDIFTRPGSKPEVATCLALRPLHPWERTSVDRDIRSRLWANNGRGQMRED